jgi:hypothetical protein
MDPTPELQQMIGQICVQLAYLRAELRLQAEIIEAVRKAAEGTAEQRQSFWEDLKAKHQIG